MKDFVLKEVVNNNIEQELSEIGFDESYRTSAADKFRYKNIKIFNLTHTQANIIKQTALSVGADCGTHKGVITANAELSNVLLGGSISQLNKISEKLRNQPFSLSNLSEQIQTFLKQKPQRKTKLAGILNITPDSFSDGGKYLKPKDAEKHLIQLIDDGADIIDIGAESTKPGAIDTEPDEQINRLKPILTFIHRENIKIPISIDTRSSVVADFALNNGASIINDVSGFDYDKKIAEVTAKYGATVIIQHSKGTPQDMQKNPEYKNVIEEVFFSLKNKTEYAKSIGIKNIIVDPGIGFGKSRENNFEILNRTEEFYALGYPVMIGASRKSLLGIKDDNNDLKDSLSLAISCPLIQKGVDYLRVHNVKLHKALLDSLSI